MRKDNVPRGILCMIAASLLLALSNAFAKYLVARYPVGEVMFLRSLLSLVVCGAFVLPAAGLAAFATQRPRAHLGRGLSQAVSQTFTVIALSLMPLASVMAIGFSAPLWAALLSVLWFGERAGAIHWAVLLTGFGGVLVVTTPGAELLQVGALFALANAVLYGSVTVAVRGMTKTEPAHTLLMWQMGTMTVCHALLLPFGFVLPSGHDLMLFAAMALTNAGAQFFWTRALSLAPAAAVSPFYYLMLVWGIGFGFVVWGDVPTASLLAGSAVVVASGVLLLWRETSTHRRDAALSVTAEGGRPATEPTSLRAGSLRDESILLSFSLIRMIPDQVRGTLSPHHAPAPFTPPGFRLPARSQGSPQRSRSAPGD
jgi:drug/metabolite transporter (DMT)-like permease